MKISRETALLLAVTYALLASAVNGDHTESTVDRYIETVPELAAAIVAGPNRKVACVSEFNYQSVASLLPEFTERVFFDTTEEIVQAVTNGDVLAGMISGAEIADPNNDLFAFASTIISPRGFLFSHDNSQSAVDMIDAAIVRLAAKGTEHSLALKNAPFEFIGIQTCKPEPQFYPFPSTENATGVLADILTSGRLKMGYFPVDMLQDGNYTASPPTGFFPEYLEEIVRIINENMNTSLTIDRDPAFAQQSSAALLTMVNAGTIHTVEPFFTIDSYYQGRARKRAFSLSCIVLGRSRGDSKFYTKRPKSSGSSSALSPGETAGVVIAVVVAVAGSIMIAVMIIRERRGKPIFAPLVTIDDELRKGSQPSQFPSAIAVDAKGDAQL